MIKQKPLARKKMEASRGETEEVYGAQELESGDPNAREGKRGDGGSLVRFVQAISLEVAEGLEKERAKRGLRSRSETIRVLLREALDG